MKRQKDLRLQKRPGRQSQGPAKKIYLPKIRLRWRLLLYLAMVLAITATLYCVITECLPEDADWILYTAAGLVFFSGIVYFIVDIRHLIVDLIIPKVLSIPFAQLLAGDYRLRTIFFAVPGLAGNVIFAVFNGVTGVMSRSAWFGSLSAYYLLLGVMRIITVIQERRISGISEKRARIRKEIAVYRTDSILFILLAVVLTGMVILLGHSQGGKSYPGFTIYAVAAYAFYKIIAAVIHMVKVKQQGSPLLTILRRVNYIDACVSILTLQTAMFASFSAEGEAFMRTMNGMTGGIVSLMVLVLGILGVVLAKRMTVKWKKEQEEQHNDSYIGSRG